MLKDFMGIGIDPHVDFAAKRVLGSPEHSRITIHFFEHGAWVRGPHSRCPDLEPDQHEGL